MSLFLGAKSGHADFSSSSVESGEPDDGIMLLAPFFPPKPPVLDFLFIFCCLACLLIYATITTEAMLPHITPMKMYVIGDTTGAVLLAEGESSYTYSITIADSTFI